MAKYSWHLAFFLAGIAAIAGLFTPFIEVDESEYAFISKLILETSSFLEIRKHGIDYLDKPPLLFWLSALSFNLFGFGEWQFKLPTFLASSVSVYAIFKIGNNFLSFSIGRAASLIQFSTVGFLMSLQDVRTDALLCSGISFAIWQLLEWHHNGKLVHVLLTGLGVGFAMLAKGPIGLMIPILVSLSLIVSKHSLGNFKFWQFLLFVTVVGILILPMCVGLFSQYGWHGLRFYFWEQSFGRITGENVWRNDAGYFFFLHTILWVLLPFTLFFLSGFYQTIKFIKTSAPNQLTIIGWFILPFVALSLSHYKLPHYIYVCISPASLISATFITKFKNDFLISVGIMIAFLMLLIVAFLNLYCFPSSAYAIGLITVSIFIASTIFFISRNTEFSGVMTMSAMSSVCMLWMNLNFFPKISAYDSGIQIGKFCKSETNDTLFVYNTSAYNIELYAQKTTIAKPLEYFSDLKKPFTVAVDEKGKQEFEKIGLIANQIKDFHHFPVSMLTIPFILPKSRESALQTRYLLQFENR